MKNKNLTSNSAEVPLIHVLKFQIILLSVYDGTLWTVISLAVFQTMAKVVKKDVGVRNNSATILRDAKISL